MKDRVRVLWIGDGGVASGFARVNESIIENLPDHYEIHHLAVNYNGDPYRTKSNHFMYPAMLGGGVGVPMDPLGIWRTQQMVQKIKPDFIFILNDPWVINDYLFKISGTEKIVAYTPVDAMYLHESYVSNLNNINQLIVYTEFGKNEILRAKPDFDSIEVIPHGVDTSKFFPVDKATAREELELSKDDFIVFNGNRNQPRKRVDLTLKAFARFAADKPSNVKLYLHMGVRDAGYQIDALAQRYGISDRIILTDLNTSPNHSVSIEHLNKIYNAVDVGINTSMGEGWGLVNVEQACCKVPQIVPNFSATAEIFNASEALHIDISELTVHLGMLTEGCVIDTTHAARCMETLYQNRDLGQQLAENAYNKFTSEEYTWKSVSKKFLDIFERVKDEKSKLVTRKEAEEQANQPVS